MKMDSKMPVGEVAVRNQGTQDVAFPNDYSLYIAKGHDARAEGNIAEARGYYATALEFVQDDPSALALVAECESILSKEPVMTDGGMTDADLAARAMLVMKTLKNPARFFDFKTFYILTSNLCNYNCYHCSNSAGSANKQFLRLDQWRAILSKVEQYVERLSRVLGYEFDKREITLCPQGYGEPLLYPYFKEALQDINQAGYSVGFNSNGSLLKGERADLLFESNLKRINISIDAGTPETYAEFRKNGRHANVVGNYERFIMRYKGRRVRPKFSASFCCTPVNTHELEQFCSYWAPRMDTLCLQQFRDGNEDLDELRVKDVKRRGVKRVFCPRLDMGYFMVRMNGDVVGCQCGDLVLGNIFEHSLEELLFSDKRIKVFQAQEQGLFHQAYECAACSFWYGNVQECEPALVSIGGRAYTLKKEIGQTMIINNVGKRVVNVDDPSIPPKSLTEG